MTKLHLPPTLDLRDINDVAQTAMMKNILALNSIFESYSIFNFYAKFSASIAGLDID